MPADQTQAARLLTLLPELDRAVCVEHRPADQEFARLCRAHREWGARDRRFFGDALFAFFRWRGWLAELLPSRPEAALALAGWLDGLEHPALQRLAAQAGLPLNGAAPEDLTAKARIVSTLLGAETKPEQLVPDWWPERLATPDGATPAAAFTRQLAALQRRPPVWLRVPPENMPAVLDFFNPAQPRARTDDRVAGAIAVTPPANLPGLRTATGVAAIVQDLASQCVGLLCAPQAGERWWDVCAGAGGKTLHLAALMNHTGSILATDIRADALHELERRAAAAQVGIVRTQPVAAVPLTEKFDGVLVDAPCSGSGTWHRNPDMRWRSGAADVMARATTQRQLLQRVAHHVRAGGVLVFAVCTMTQAETCAVTAEFTRTHPEFQPDELIHPLTGVRQRSPFWVWPWTGPCDGMFIARWRHRGVR